MTIGYIVRAKTGNGLSRLMLKSNMPETWDCSPSVQGGITENGINGKQILLLGFIPKYSSKKTKVTMTLKQNYMPWSINIGKGFSTEPLACGLYLNTVFRRSVLGKRTGPLS